VNQILNYSLKLIINILTITYCCCYCLST